MKLDTKKLFKQAQSFGSVIVFSLMLWSLVSCDWPEKDEWVNDQWGKPPIELKKKENVPEVVDEKKVENDWWINGME